MPDTTTQQEKTSTPVVNNNNTAATKEKTKAATPITSAQQIDPTKELSPEETAVAAQVQEQENDTASATTAKPADSYTAGDDYAPAQGLDNVLAPQSENAQATENNQNSAETNANTTDASADNTNPSNAQTPATSAANTNGEQATQQEEKAGEKQGRNAVSETGKVADSAVRNATASNTELGTTEATNAAQIKQEETQKQAENTVTAQAENAANNTIEKTATEKKSSNNTEEKETSAQSKSNNSKVILFDDELGFVPLFADTDGKFDYFTAVDNYSLATINTNAEAVEDFVSVNLNESSTDIPVYVSNRDCQYSIDEVVKAVPHPALNKYGMIWRENMSEDELVIHLIDKGLSKENANFIDKEDIATYFALLRNEPDSNPDNVSKILDYNTRVLIHSVPFPGWAFVELDTGEKGYVKLQAINYKMPSSGSKLYRIQDGDNVSELTKKHYKGDWRYYGNVLFYVNNPKNESSGSIVCSPDIWGKLQMKLLDEITDSQSLELIAPRWIWLPDQAYADSLVNEVSSGDVSKEINERINEGCEAATEFVDKVWPAGFGVQLDANFGIPIGLEGDIVLAMQRKDDNHIVINKFLKGGLGIDTGLGGGVSTGAGKYGAGAEVGVHAKVMGEILSEVEYAFPLNESTAIISIINVLRNAAEPAMM